MADTVYTQKAQNTQQFKKHPSSLMTVNERNGDAMQMESYCRRFITFRGSVFALYIPVIHDTNVNSDMEMYC